MSDDTSPTQLLVRPPADYLRPDFQELDHRRTVAFFHPGYPLDAARHDPATEILRLPAYDNGGFHHGTALSALSIIAFNNCGYLTVDTPNGTRVREAWDYVLPGNKNYYYHLNDLSAGVRYPICSSFADWPFESSVIPADWHSAFNPTSSNMPIVINSHMSSSVHQRDVSCRITNSPDATGSAHIIPRAEHIWFINNGLQVYNFSLRSSVPSATDDVQNGILLRKDLHFMFDQNFFVPVVKAGVLVSHYLKYTAAAAALYHNAQVRLPDASPPVEFFWARFGWSILSYVGPFDERIRLIPRLHVHVEQAEMTPKTRKRKDTAPVPTQRKRGSSRVLRKRVTASHAPGDNTGVTNPPEVPARQLALETERDNEVRRRFFPRMSKYPLPLLYAALRCDGADMVVEEETSWSGDWTWQFAQWYPGMEHMERVKNWWRESHPQITDWHGRDEREESGDVTCGEKSDVVSSGRAGTPLSIRTDGVRT